MALIVWLDPTLVNVLTDVLLLILQIVWLKTMAILTALDLKRRLRKGLRLFSYEHIGTFQYFRYGLRKYRRLQKTGKLEEDQKSQIRFQIFIAALSGVFTAALVLLHVLIDYGLDFQFSPRLSGESAAYGMVGLAANETYMKTLRQGLSRLDTFMNDCIDGDLTMYEDCARTQQAARSLVFDRLREGTNFAKMIYDSSSLEQVDVIERIEWDYNSADEVDLTISRHEECLVKPQSNLNGFNGNFTFITDRCTMKLIFVRQLQLDMRAKEVRTQQTRDSRQSEQVKQLLATDNVGLDLVSYEKFKDDRQQEETFVKISALTTNDTDTMIHKRFKGLVLEANSGVEYADGMRQSLRVTDLSKRHTGLFGAETNFVIDLNADHNDEPFGQAQITPFGESDAQVFDLKCRSPQSQNSGKLPYKITLWHTGEDGEPVICGTYEAFGASDICQEDTVTYSSDETVAPVKMGFQKGEVVVGLRRNGEDDCVERAHNQFSNQLVEATPENTMYFVSFQFETVCAEIPSDGTNRRMACAYGPKAQYWTGTEFVDAAAAEARGDLLPIETKGSVTWVSMEVIGSLDGVEPVFANIEIILREYYAELRAFSHRAVTRGRLFGARLHFSVRDVLAVVSTQVGLATRNVQLVDKIPVASLRDEYLAGFFAVIIITGLAIVVTFIFFVSESIAYRHLDVRFRVPLTITEWIQTAIAGGADYIGDTQEQDHSIEFSAMRSEDPLSQRSLMRFSSIPEGIISSYQAP